MARKLQQSNIMMVHELTFYFYRPQASSYLDVGGGGGAEQSSVDFSNLPISSDPQSKEQCPKQKHPTHLIRDQPTNLL